MRWTKKNGLFAFLAGAVLVTPPAAAKEFYVGEPIVKNDMQLVPHYLLGIEMAPMVKGMAMGPNAVHIEIDVHATKDDKHGFKEDEWIPYLTISYTIEKVGSKFKNVDVRRAYPRGISGGVQARLRAQAQYQAIGQTGAQPLGGGTIRQCARQWWPG